MLGCLGSYMYRASSALYIQSHAYTAMSKTWTGPEWTHKWTGLYTKPVLHVCKQCLPPFSITTISMKVKVAYINTHQGFLLFDGHR